MKGVPRDKVAPISRSLRVLGLHGGHAKPDGISRAESYPDATYSDQGTKR
jgi:hypothetical protein